MTSPSELIKRAIHTIRSVAFELGIKKIISETDDILKQFDEMIELETSAKKVMSRVINSSHKENAELQAQLTRYQQALEKIANEDFRGNRPQSSVIAYEALLNLKRKTQ